MLPISSMISRRYGQSRQLGLASIMWLTPPQIPGIESVHELHVWRLDQKKAIASAHIVVSDPDVASFMDKAKTIRECLHAYGIHSTTLQPELVIPRSPRQAGDITSETASETTPSAAPCQILCGMGMCDHLTCCNTVTVVPL